MVVVLIVVLALLVLLVLGIYAHNARQASTRRALDLGLASAAADEDVKHFANDLAELKTAPAMGSLTSGTQREYERALESLDTAGIALAKADNSLDIGQVTEALERGGYAAACVRARLSGRQLPSRRPPCFFNPQHGPSNQDVDWAPRGEEPRPLPSCADDAERVAVGAEPDIRKVIVGNGTYTVDYWRAGTAFAGYVHGYFGGFAASGRLPGPLSAAMQAALDAGSRRSVSAGGRGPDVRADN